MKYLFLTALVAVFCSGCVAHIGIPTTNVVYANPSPTIVVSNAPPRVYFEGTWLHYRSNAYYRYYNNSWVVARRVPRHVVRYHHRHVSRTPRHVRHRRHARRHR